MYLFGYVPRVAAPHPSHRSSRGEAILSESTFMPALVSLPGVFRHVVALVRYLTGFESFAAWAPRDMQPSGEGRSGQLWPHFRTRWPPTAHREVHFVSTQNTRIATTCGMSDLRRYVGAGLLRPDGWDGDKSDSTPGPGAASGPFPFAANSME
jgi:hypothetical protein